REGDVYTDELWFDILGMHFSCLSEAEERDLAELARNTFLRATAPSAGRCDDLARAQEPTAFSPFLTGTLSVENGAVRLRGIRVKRNDWPPALTNPQDLEGCYRDVLGNAVVALRSPSLATHFSIIREVKAHAQIPQPVTDKSESR